MPMNGGTVIFKPVSIVAGLYWAAAVAPVPPPSDLLHTTYDMWHASGMDLAPYTRLYEVMRDRILGRDVPADPAAGTFADGVANQAAVDAIRASSAAGGWVAVEV